MLFLLLKNKLKLIQELPLGLVTRLTSGHRANEISMPIVPACGEGEPVKYKYRQTPSPITEEENAPASVVLFHNKPHIKGPKNAAPIAPHEIPRIITIVEGLKYASTTDIIININANNLIKLVSVLSVAFGLINPA